MLKTKLIKVISLLTMTAMILTILIPYGTALAAGTADVTISVDNSTPLCEQPFQGVGGHLTAGTADYMGTERGMTEGDFQLFKARAKKMEIKFARHWVWYDWFQPAENTTTYESPAMQGFYKYLDVYQSIGTDVLFQVPSGTASKLYPWAWQSDTDNNAGPGSDPAVKAKWASDIANIIKYMHDIKGYTCIKYFSITNEPINTPENAAYMSDLYKTIKDKFISEGIDYIKVLGPDQVYYPEYMTNFITSAYDSIDAYSYHCYQDDNKSNIVSIKNTCDPNGSQKGLIFTEYGVGGGTVINDSSYDNHLSLMHMTINNMNEGFTGFSKWTLYDSFFDYPTCRANQTGTTDLNDGCWGAWKSKDFDWMPRDVYYMWSLFTKFTKLDATQYKTTSSDANSVITSVVKNPDGNYSVFAVNTSDSPKAVQFDLTSGINKTLYKFVVDGNTQVDKWATIVSPSGAINVDSSFTDTIPAKSFVAYTSDWNPSAAVGTVSNVQTVNGKVTKLTWDSADNAWYYRVYRGTTADFTPSSSNMVGESADNNFIDETKRDFSAAYYYKVVVVGKYEQIGAASASVQSDPYSFSGAVSFADSDDGTNYTITSDKADTGYQYKINKSNGLSKTFKDVNGKNAYAQVIYGYGHPGGVGDADQAAVVSTPAIQADGTVKVDITKGTASYSYDFSTDNVKLTAGAPLSIDDYGYKDIKKIIWDDNSIDEVSGGSTLSKNTTGFTLIQDDRDTAIKFEFSSARDITIATDSLKVCSITHPKFSLSSGDSYTMSFVKNIYSTSLTNLALNKAVTASSSPESGNLFKANATDGDTGSYWTSSDSTDSNHTEWVTVDLGSNNTINKVSLLPRNDIGNIGQGFPIDFTIQLSSDNANWVTVTTQSAITLPGSTAKSYTFPCKNARYVKIEGTNLRQNPSDSSYKMQLAEIEVYNTADIALNKAVYVSSSLGPGGMQPSNAVDGDKSNMWTSNDNLNSDHTEWITVDLGKNTNVGVIDLYPRNDAGHIGESFPVDFEIQTSVDNVNWTTVTSRTNFEQPGDNVLSFPINSRNARYIRVKGTRLRQNPNDGNTYRMQLAEIEVYIADNLALKKPVEVSSTLDIVQVGLVKENATDGDISNMWTSNNDLATNHTEWITVDLGGSKSVNQVYLYPRNDGANLGEGFPVDFTIQVSTDNTNWNTVVTQSNYSKPGNCAQIFDFIPQMARYIKIEGTSFRPNAGDNNMYRMQLGEIEIYGRNDSHSISTDSSIAVTGLTLNKTSANISLGSTLTLSAGIEPENADNKAVTWSSSNPSAATVDGNGTVTAVGTGNAIITATSEDSSISTTCNVNVVFNLAIDKTVFVSSAFDDAGLGILIKNAVDGNLNNMYSSLSNPGVDHNEWITIDLGQQRSIERVKLYPRGDSGNIGEGFPVDFTIQVSDDNATWKTIVIQTNYAKPDQSAQTFSFPAQNARYVKINGEKLRMNAGDANSYRMQFAEIEIYGVKPVENITVGSENNTTSLNNLGDTLKMNATVLPDDATDKSVTWSVCNEDGSATNIAEIDSATGVLTAKNFGTVKVVATANDGSGVKGFEKISIVDLSGTANYALNKTVTASSAFDDAGLGILKANAVDGNLNNMFSSLNDADKNHTEWMMIDLGQIYNIGKVDLYPRNDAGSVGEGFPVDFTIQVSQDNSNWVKVTDITGYGKPDGTVQSFTFPAQNARYVKIEGTSLRMNPGDNNSYRLQFGEVSVYGKQKPLPILKRTGRISMDGNLDDSVWNLGTELKINSGNSDNTAKLGTLWDDNNFYVALDITDANVINSGAAYPWNDDSIELYIDGDLCKGNYNEHTVQYIFRWNDIEHPVYKYGNDAASTDGISPKWQKTDKGYTLEVAIPWSAIGMSVTEGKTIGFTVHVNDKDVNDKNADSYSTLGLTDMNYGDYCNSAYWADMQLVKGKKLSKLNLSADKTAMKVNETASCSVAGKLEDNSEADLTDAKVEYFTDKPEIVSLENGTVKALAAGAANVWAEATLDGATVDSDAITMQVSSNTENSGTENNNNNSGNTSNANVKGSVITINNQITQNGTATAVISGDDLEKAFKNSVADSNGDKTVKVNIVALKGVNEYVQQLPKAAFQGKDDSEKISIETPVGAFTLPANILNGTTVKGNNIAVCIAASSKPVVSDDIAKQVAGKPVIELSFKADGKVISWNNPDAPVRVSIDYKPTAEELKNPEHIVVWYLDGTGKAVSVPNGKYDPVSGKVIFTTTHFSQYAVAYVNRSFNDISAVKWASNQIEVLASKGIVDWSENTSFNPGQNITRGEFMALLVRALGLTAKADANFSDVSPDYKYYQEIGIAKKLGIANGIGNNRFSPDDAISRQDMIVLTEKTLRFCGRITTKGNVADLKAFKDAGRISSYAKQSIATLFKEDIVHGEGNVVNPLGFTTRAAAAAVIYNIIKQH